ncbi:MAG: OB-fold nucleic acid binding domain-containing protein, partial [Gammaproteobacteria bacterium]
LERTLGVPIFQEQVMQLAIVAAGFSPGEADQLRRAMAAWRKRGGLEHFEQRLVDGMAGRGYEESFARQIYQQILGFGEYGFPESHAASFALLVYVSSWFKRYHPAAFCAALINAQPMGFYAPAQLVGDARRHGVEVLPVDVTVSDWDCALEAGAGDAPSQKLRTQDSKPRTPHLRLGIRLIKGLSREVAGRIRRVRSDAPLASVDDLAQRARLDRRDLEALAAAGALNGLSGNRHQTRWKVSGVVPDAELWQDSAADRERAVGTPMLPVPTEGGDIVADYASVGLTLGRHPVALLRSALDGKRFMSAEHLWQRRHGQLARACGLVINRQRPASANGVVFVTLEDETGFVNVVVWEKLVQRQRKTLLGSRLLGVLGRIEREAGVLYVVADQLQDHSRLLGRLTVSSRDFH